MHESKDQKNRVARIEGAKAYLKSLQEGADAGLAELTGKDDNESIRRRLQILLDAERIKEAADIVRGKSPDPRWISLAIFALAANCEVDIAKQYCKSARTRGEVKQCLVACVQGRLYALLRSKDKAEVRWLDLTPDETEELTDCLGDLHQVISTIDLNGKIEDEVESTAVELALRVTGMLRKRNECESLAELLATRKPVSIVLAYAAMEGWISPPDNLPERLRQEHDGSFEMSLAACAVEGQVLRRQASAFRSALTLVECANSDDRRERLYYLLHSLSQGLGEEDIEIMVSKVPLLLSHNIRLLSLHKALEFIREENPDEAMRIIVAYEDESDPLWLQVKAYYHLSKREAKLASDCLVRASRQILDPELLWKTAEVAHQSGQMDETVEALERLVEMDPDAVTPRGNLAAIYLQRGQYVDAARHLGELTRLAPEDDGDKINYAASLALCGRYEEALDVYTELCSRVEPPLQAVLGYAKLLNSQGKPLESFNLLLKHRQRGVDDEEYLTVFLNTAYMAGVENTGGEAFAELMRLHSQGKADSLHKFTVDEVLDMMRQYRSQDELIHESVSSGRAPWLLAEQVMNRASLLGWSARTQPFKWGVDDRIERARYSIYGTNGFCISKGHRLQPSLELLQCPSQGTTIVADLSALITLHQLGILSEAGNYFGKILIPSAYLVNALDEANKLVLHQASLKPFYEGVDYALRDGRVQVLHETGVPGNRPIPFLSEYTTEEEDVEHFYRLIDLLDVLREAGQIDDEKYRSAKSPDLKKTEICPDYPALRMSQEVCINLSSLRTIASWGLLDSVIKAFKIYVTDLDQNEIERSLSAMQHQENIRISHQALWDAVRNDKHFTAVAVPTAKKLESGGESSSLREVPIAACFLAREEMIPLLADDRACQMVVLNNRKDDLTPAFGTDRLLLGLQHAEILDANQTADAFLRLMQWRYRFIIPPGSVLKTLADRFVSNLPGKQLRDVARYAHDCMRDPGLFSGFEDTTPPTSMATTLFCTWLQMIIEFVMDIWADDRYSDNSAIRLTEWAVTEFLPSTPLSLEPHLQVSLATLMAERSVFMYAMLRLPKVQDIKRGQRAIAAIAEGFGIDVEGDEYARMVSEVIRHASLH